MRKDDKIHLDGITLRLATLRDVQELLNLYFIVYGNTYPLALGTNRDVMSKIIADDRNLWMVAIEDVTGHIIGSGVIEVESQYRIGRAEGFVVHPDHQRKGIAAKILSHGSNWLLEETKLVNSIYATTRTMTVGPQLVFLKEGYLPLGIFPNAHRLQRFETLTLMAKFARGVLESRQPIAEVPEALGPILKTLGRFVKTNYPMPKLLKTVKPNPCGERLEFDMIHAPAYVQRKFFETFSDPLDRFYPFHKPNFLISARNGEVDMYGYLGESDGYCTLVATTEPTYSMAGRLRPLMRQLKDFGVTYLEILMSMENTSSLEALLDVEFLPSAIYPAMVEYDGKFVDLVLMSRSMEPLDFRGMQIERSFKPYFDQYIELWKRMHLEVLGVFDEKP